jgi:hypothetical protein
MSVMDSVVGSQRPLAPLYRPDERFEISAAGLEEWYRSDCFRRVAAFYAGYPERSIFADNGRALMHHLIVMLRPDRLLEIGTMYAEPPRSWRGPYGKPGGGTSRPSIPTAPSAVRR